jgi:hypothetical protein
MQQRRKLGYMILAVLVVAGLGLGAWLLPGDEQREGEPEAPARQRTRLQGMGIAALLRQAPAEGEVDSPDPGVQRPGRFQRLVRPPQAEEDQEVDEELIETLQALGYAAATQNRASLRGVTVHDRERAWPGLNFYVSGHGPEAVLIDMDGRVLHRWRKALQEVWPDRRFSPLQKRSEFWRRARLYPGGEIVAIFEIMGIIRLDRRSRVIWANDMPAHHDMQLTPEGNLYVLSRASELIPDVHPTAKVIAEYICELDPRGRELRRVSLVDCARRADPPYDFVWKAIQGRSGDILHANTLELLADPAAAGAPSAFRPGTVLTSFRTIDTIALVDLEQEKIVWAYRGDFRRQHEPRMIPGGRLLLFDNEGLKDRSRVLEYDLTEMLPVWRYSGDDKHPFYSATCGANQRLPNGNTLITESDNGRAFEVTPDGRIVWEFYNPHRAGENGDYIASLFEVVRVPESYVADWLRSGSGEADHPQTHQRRGEE